ncbi:MAG: SulP family inorganic anion transporter [Beijerinckiaceae bacterium]|nr:SulP family inorganic anion transporter [Beijerinckiaceae bacterium]
MTTVAAGPTFLELYTPKLVTVLRERYKLADFKADVLAGLTVAIVALPLSMAIAIASGVTPDRGLFSAIVGGFFVSLLGGSRFQIGGPAGAFIVLVAATANRYGLDGLLLATFLSGFILLAIGYLRLGTFIKYIPYPVTVGFTAGIAVIIFVSQIKDLLGLSLTGKEPGPVLEKLAALSQALPSLNLSAVAVAALTIGVIAGVRKARPHWPSLLIAVALASIVAAAFHLPVETIGTRFGGIPHSLPAPHLPAMSLAKILEILPAALSFALLGGIESLLSAVVADSMSGRRHRSNCELVAQGAANIAASLFGGICVTGTIARTATNVRSGARSPIAGMLHSLFLLVFMFVAAPLASYIPLPALAGVLAVVAWNMAERHAIATLLRASRGDAVVLLTTFLLVVFRDLTEGILTGFGIGTLLFVHRMAMSVETGSVQPMVREDRADRFEDDDVVDRDDALALASDVIVFRVQGAFFFGAAAAVGTALDDLPSNPRAYVIDVSAVPVLDSTAAATIEAFAKKVRGRGIAVFISGASIAVRRVLLGNGVRAPGVQFSPSIQDAVRRARESENSLA